MKTMKTCKYGCGKIKSGGKVATGKKMAKGGATKKYADGGSTIVGMPQYSNNPRTYSGRMLKEGGSFAPNRTVKTSCKGGLVTDFDGKCVTERKMKSGGPLKPVPAGKVGLSKLPTAVRNKMGYAKKGGIKKR